MTTGTRTEGLRGIGSNGFIRTVANLTVTGDLVVLGENRALAGTGSYFWEDADADAEYWAFELPTGTSAHVPVLGIGVGLDGVDLGLFDGITQPTMAVMDADRDSFIAIDYSADDAARLRSNAAMTITTSSGALTLTPTTDVHITNGTGLVIGHTAQITNAQLAELQVLGTGAADSMAILGRWSADSGAPELAFVKSRDPAIADGSFAIVENADPVGQLRFYPDDGVDFQTLAAQFRGVVDDSSPAAGDIGMAFVWSQMPGGGGGLAETMRLTAAGSLTLNQASTISTAAGALTLDPTTDIIVAAGKEVVIGHTAPLNVRDTWENTPTPQLSVVANTSPTIAIVTNNATAARGGSLVFVRSKSNTLGSVTSVADGDALGGIGWVGADGNDYYTQAAKITAFVDGTPGTDDMPGRLSFATTADDGGLATERMRLDSAGFLSLRSSVDTAVVADVVGFSRYEIGAGNTVLGISQETAVASDTDETKFSHKMQVRINGATYFIMLTDT